MTERLDAVESALSEYEPGPVVTQAGTVDLLSVTVQDGCVSVMVGDPAGGDPHFRIYNPPTLVPDPDGDVDRAGVRYRVDPIAAVAHAVALNGGARRDRVRRA